MSVANVGDSGFVEGKIVCRANEEFFCCLEMMDSCPESKICRPMCKNLNDQGKMEKFRILMYMKKLFQGLILS